MLKEIIQLYNFPDSEKTAAFINGIQDMKMKRITRRILLDGLPAFVQGLEVSIVFDEQYFTGRSLWLFASVLEQFLAQYISMNAFIEFVAITPDEKLLHRWPPRAGNQFSL